VHHPEPTAALPVHKVFFIKMADECDKEQSPPDNYDDDKDNEEPSDDDEEDYRPMQKSRGRGNYR
jgi:hypothetical protein